MLRFGEIEETHLVSLRRLGSRSHCMSSRLTEGQRTPSSPQGSDHVRRKDVDTIRTKANVRSAKVLRN